MSLVVDSLYGILLFIGLVVHPLGDGLFWLKALYHKAYLPFSDFYVGIRGLGGHFERGPGGQFQWNSPEWHELFTLDELQRCEKRLADYEYFETGKE